MAVVAYALCTLADMKIELSIDTGVTTDDAKIERAIDAATDLIERETNRKLAPHGSDVTEDYDGYGEFICKDGTQLWPIDWPITTANITSLEDDTERNFDGSSKLVTDYVIRYGRYIELSDIAGPRVFNSNWQNIRLTYDPGYATVPNDLQRACVIIAKDLYWLEKTQRQNVASMSRNDGSKTYKDYAIHPLAEKIIEHYKRGWIGELPEKMARIP